MKKTEFITLRTDAKTKALLAQIAAEKKWSISQLTEEIIQQWLQENINTPQEEIFVNSE